MVFAYKLRYAIVEIRFEKVNEKVCHSITTFDLLKALRESIVEHFGDVGAGHSMTSLQGNINITSAAVCAEE